MTTTMTTIRTTDGGRDHTGKCIKASSSNNVVINIVPYIYIYDMYVNILHTIQHNTII